MWQLHLTSCINLTILQGVHSNCTEFWFPFQLLNLKWNINQCERKAFSQTGTLRPSIQRLHRCRHLVKGEMIPGEEIGIHVDQTLTQDATGTLDMLELEAMDLHRVKTGVSVQFVDHNLIQADFKTPDDHLFLFSAFQRFGL